MELICPKISVIVPTYNRAKQIKGCIESVLIQSLTNIELIIVSDGSTDQTEQVVKSFQDPRIVFLEKQNGGQASARNLGILKSKGPYISLCDDDDRFYADHLATLCDTLDQHQEVGLVYSDSLWKYNDEQRKPEVKYSQDFDKKSLEDYNYITPLNILFRKSCIEVCDYFDEQIAMKGLEDWDFFLRLSDHFSFLHIKKVTSEYNVHEGNSFQTGTGYDYNKAFFVVRTKRFEHLQSNYGPQLFDHVDHMYPFHLVQCYLSVSKFQPAVELADRLDDLYKKYAKDQNRAPFTELLIYFAQSISNFAVGRKEVAHALLKKIQTCQSYGEIEQQFCNFVRQYIALTPDPGLKKMLGSCFIIT